MNNYYSPHLELGLSVEGIVLSKEELERNYIDFLSVYKFNNKGNPFTGFGDGIAATWEGYKSSLRQEALAALSHDRWKKSDIGTGRIIEYTISAIELKSNNLVFWPNRFGHSNREHASLIDALIKKTSRIKIEEILYDMFKEGAEYDVIFDGLRKEIGSKYPLIAYLFFLKDDALFLPIQPSSFDRIFQRFNLIFRTRGECSWINYSTYNGIIEGVRRFLSEKMKQPSLSLLDAHSFCWLLEKLPRDHTALSKGGKKDTGRVLSKREEFVIKMCGNVLKTVQQSNGQQVLTRVKNKELRMQPLELEYYVKRLLDIQQDKCALTGIPFIYNSIGLNENLQPSVDRIDSNGHYEEGNLQVVCRFINFWKGSSDNSEFKYLLALVRQGEEAEIP